MVSRKRCALPCCCGKTCRCGLRAFEAPGALGCDGAGFVARRSDVAAGWEYAETPGRAIGIRRLCVYDAQSASSPFLGYSKLLKWRRRERPG